MSVNPIPEKGYDPSPKTATPSHFIDKQWLRRRLAETDAEIGFVIDPSATAQKARELMLADGIHPEDNGASREIMRLRYEEDQAR